nr:ASN_HP1_G0005020.mRNA.1.CDS.1 [Saccharomyces cerevisiae]
MYFVQGSHFVANSINESTVLSKGVNAYYYIRLVGDHVLKGPQHLRNGQIVICLLILHFANLTTSGPFSTTIAPSQKLQIEGHPFRMFLLLLAVQ